MILAQDIIIYMQMTGLIIQIGLQTSSSGVLAFISESSEENEKTEIKMDSTPMYNSYYWYNIFCDLSYNTR